jgi:hypothetical protein
MTVTQLAKQAGRVEVNLAPLLLILGTALAGDSTCHIEGMVDVLFIDPDQL